ncbi:MAG: hypothetical protein QY302_09235 [Anaerolineales bacterium]|nr:MAG: hypothetical protein QY302_09235 [Anaerolineales bacterium]
MKNKSCIYTVFLFFLLTNCTYPSASQSEIQSSPSAIPIVGSTPTKLTAPSAIPLATFTATESLIVGSGSLSALGSPPYLVYVKKVNHKEQVVLVNQDGSGSKTIPLPANGFNAGNPSPTGEWLVFYTGSGGMQTLTDGPEYDLALNLMHLPDGATRKITNLLSKDFPANLEKFAEMAKSNNSELSSIDTKTIAEQARQTLIYRLMLGQWSPSGEAFAFAGEMYGPSTDLYLYNVKTDNFQRLSSGSRNIDFIKWFPNGEKILYGSSYLPCLGDCSTYFVTSLDGLDSKELQGFETFGGSTKMGDWFGDEFLTMYTTANVSGDCCLRNYD